MRKAPSSPDDAFSSITNYLTILFKYELSTINDVDALWQAADSLFLTLGRADKASVEGIYLCNTVGLGIDTADTCIGRSHIVYKILLSVFLAGNLKELIFKDVGYVDCLWTA